MKINGVAIKLGGEAKVEIKVGGLPSGSEINLFAHVFRSKKKGPTLLVLGGVHGDEINGVEIVRRAVKSGMFKNLKIGSVIAVPLLNVYGFINFSRDLPDGKDVNRSFPGISRGSLASKVAYTLTKHILPLVDIGIDFHTGGSARYNYPQIRVKPNDKKCFELAKIFNPPFIVKSGLINKSLRKECDKRGIPMLVFEGGESLRLDSFSVQEGLSGIKRLMNHLEMKDEEVPSRKSIIVNKSKWIRASQAGLFLVYKKSGEYVEKGDVLGYLTDPYGNNESKITAKTSGILYGHNNIPVVNMGDALYHIGTEIED